MKKSELVAIVAQKLKVSRKTGRDFVDSFLGEITKALARGEKVKLAGFGVFWTRLFREKLVLPIGKSQKKKVAARRMPRFTPGNNLKRSVR